MTTSRLMRSVCLGVGIGGGGSSAVLTFIAVRTGQHFPVVLASYGAVCIVALIVSRILPRETEL